MPIDSWLFRRALVTFLLVLGALAARPPQVDAIPFPFSFSNDFDDYGRTQNFTCPTAANGVCAAIAASIVGPSKHGPSGSPTIGMKWSKTDTQS